MAKFNQEQYSFKKCHKNNNVSIFCIQFTMSLTNMPCVNLHCFCSYMEQVNKDGFIMSWMSSVLCFFGVDWLHVHYNTKNSHLGFSSIAE